MISKYKSTSIMCDLYHKHWWNHEIIVTFCLIDKASICKEAGNVLGVCRMSATADSLPFLVLLANLQGQFGTVADWKGYSWSTFCGYCCFWRRIQLKKIWRWWLELRKKLFRCTSGNNKKNVSQACWCGESIFSHFLSQCKFLASIFIF